MPIRWMFALWGFLAFLPTSQAQVFLIEPTADFVGIAHFDEFNIFQVYLINQEEDPLDLTWRMVENTIPEGWYITLCDNVACYGTLPTQAQMNPIAALDSAILKLDINPYQQPGSGVIRFRIYETGSQNNYTELSFTIETIPTGLQIIPATSYAVFPNPAVEQVQIRNQSDQPMQVSLHNAQGQLLRTLEVAQRTTQAMPVQALAPGGYHLRLQSEDRVATERILILAE